MDEKATIRAELVARFAHDRARETFLAHWQARAATFPPEARVPSDGLDAVLVQLPTPNDPTPATFACLSFPTAVCPEEVHFLAIGPGGIYELANVPARDQPSRYRHHLRFHDWRKGWIRTHSENCAPEREAFLQACRRMAADP